MEKGCKRHHSDGTQEADPIENVHIVTQLSIDQVLEVSPTCCFRLLMGDLILVP